MEFMVIGSSTAIDRAAGVALLCLFVMTLILTGYSLITGPIDDDPLADTDPVDDSQPTRL